ncbi:hypothetical protein [Bacteroides acidifaciens]|uniref:hypothetical protein n=1 Tax=Bacteroides acidifaciens TaxID=85831 RepID=UPI003F693145
MAIPVEETIPTRKQDTRGAVHGGGDNFQDTVGRPENRVLYAGLRLSPDIGSGMGKEGAHTAPTLHERTLIYAGALTLDVECYVADRIALLPTCETFACGVATQEVHTQFGRCKFIIG